MLKSAAEHSRQKGYRKQEQHLVFLSAKLWPSRRSRLDGQVSQFTASPVRSHSIESKWGGTVGHFLGQGWWSGIGTIAVIVTLIFVYLTYKQGKAEVAEPTREDKARTEGSTRGAVVRQIISQGGRTRTSAIVAIASLIVAFTGFVGLLTYRNSPPTPETAGNGCSFVVDGTTTCSSTNPQVQVYASLGGDTSGCIFVRDIDWGDGTSSGNIEVKGGAAGLRFVDNHTYEAPGSYTIYFGGEVTQGGCLIKPPTFRFELLS
jgi:hypothetical protein